MPGEIVVFGNLARLEVDTVDKGIILSNLLQHIIIGEVDDVESVGFCEWVHDYFSSAGVELALEEAGWSGEIWEFVGAWGVAEVWLGEI